VAEGAPLLRE